MTSIKKNFVYSSILTTANYVFPLLTYPYVSRVLGVTNIGICNFIDSIINYYIMFSLMGINIIGIRSVAASKSNKQKLSLTLSNLFWLNTISTAIVVVALIVSIFSVPKLYEYKELMLVGVFKVVFSYLMIEWFYKGIEDFKFITYRGIVVKIVYVAGVFLFIRNKEDYTTYYILSVMMIVLNAVINIAHSRKLAHISFLFKEIKIKPYVPAFLILGIYALLTSMYTTFNVTFLGFACNETEVGYYTTATKLHTIFLGIFSAFTGVMLPRMSSLMHEGKKEEFRELISKSIRVLFAFSLPLIAFTMTMAPQIIGFIAGPGYENAVAPMQIVMPLIIVIGYEQIIVIQVLMPMKKDRAIFIGACAGAIAGLLCNIIIVPHLKSPGSAIVWVISELTVLSISQHYVNKYIKFKLPTKSLVQYALAAMPCFAMLYTIGIFSPFGNFGTLAIGFVILVAYYIIVYSYIIKDSIAINILLPLKKKISHLFCLPGA